VIASGDIVDRASAERVLDSTGAAAVMVGRGAQGQPWTLQEMAERSAERPEPAEVVAELIRFMREVEREMGDRAASFLRKFYGWYLRGMPDAKSVKPALTSAPTVAEAEAALLRFCPGARDRLAEHEAELALLPDTGSDRLLDLPISIYGGG
jgi:tRNA-dihydrouridine synthase B